MFAIEAVRKLRERNHRVVARQQQVTEIFCGIFD
jgi:hypothetical protein